MICNFDDPIENETGDFEFSTLNCLLPDYLEVVQNPETPEREFYLEKTMTYGEGLIIWFLTIFLMLWIAKSIYNFFWGK